MLRCDKDLEVRPDYGSLCIFYNDSEEMETVSGQREPPPTEGGGSDLKIFEERVFSFWEECCKINLIGTKTPALA